jgi:hypothetical protein
LNSFTEAVTIRFDKKLLNQLRIEARKKQISLNALLNQLASAHVEWHTNATEAGFMPKRKALIKSIFELLTKEQIDSLAQRAEHHLAGETMMIMTKKLTEQSVLELIERWIRMSGFQYYHTIDRDNHIFVIQHNMGEKWSYYLSRLFEEVSSRINYVKPEVQMTNNVLLVRLRKASYIERLLF